MVFVLILYKATGHRVCGDCERVLFYEINGGGEEEHPTSTSTDVDAEVRGWVRTKVGTQGALISRPIQHHAT